MTQNLSDTWIGRDLPVLVAIARGLDEEPGQHVDSRYLEVDGVDSDDIARAMAALDHAYINSRTVVPGVVVLATGLTERGRRAAGLWPSGEGVDALVSALQQAAESATDEDEKGALRKAAGAIMSVSERVMTEVVASVVAKSVSGA